MGFPSHTLCAFFLLSGFFGEDKVSNKSDISSSICESISYIDSKKHKPPDDLFLRYRLMGIYRCLFATL